MYYKFFLLILTSYLVGFSSTGQSQTNSKGLNPPANLVIEHELENPNVYLTWWAPGTPYWLHYDSGEFATSIGLNAPGEFDVLVVYEPDQIKPFVGMGITQFAFAPDESASIYVLKIWTGDMADSVIYEDTLSNLAIGSWNIVELDSAVVLEADRLYFFGYHVNAQGGYPAGCDAGPTVIPGKSDLLRLSDGKFYSLNYSGIDVNWNIEVYLEPQSQKAPQKVALNKELALTVGKSNALQSNLLKEPLSFHSPVKATAPEWYKVYRNNEMVGTSNTHAYHDSLTLGGFYTYAVSAVYSDGESERSDSVEIIYDTYRIPVNKVVAEAFIHTDPTGSPSSYGVYSGMFELEFEQDKVAPIVYHSGTSVFGPDPFSIEDGENRWMEYFLIYQGFPMAVFNGDFVIPGGSGDESLYIEYRDLYNQALERLTPIGFSFTIEKVSNSKYTVHATANKVGFYKGDTLKLHVVLTRDSIAYDWYNGKFDQVSFVASGMFPNFNGTAFVFGDNSTITRSVTFEIDPFEKVDNYRIVAFIQDAHTYQVLNGDILKLPQKRAVNFTVLDGSQPLENATVSVNGNILTTNSLGQAAVNLFDNLGEVSFMVSKDKYETHTGVFNMDTASQITINLVYNSITETQIAIRLYPNPVNNQLFIQTTNPVVATLFDVSGVQVLQEQLISENQPLDLSQLEPGIYFVKVLYKENYYSYRIVKQ